jgi:excisionase family DNA binding protein
VNGTDGFSERELGGRLLTAKEVGELLQLNTSRVLDAARRNAIPHIRLGRYVRFRRIDIETWLSDQRRGPNAASEKRR